MLLLPCMENFFYKCEIPLCRKFRKDNISDYAGEMVVYSIVLVILFHYKMNTFFYNALKLNTIKNKN